MDLSIVLTGPLTTRGPLLAALGRAGCDLGEPQQPDPHWRQTFGETDLSTGYVNVRHADLDEVVGIAAKSGWRLLMHWHTPACGVCHGFKEANGPTGAGTCLHCRGKGVSNLPAPDPLRVELDQLRSRLAVLEASK